jgi:hypothetical protein
MFFPLDSEGLFKEITSAGWARRIPLRHTRISVISCFIAVGFRIGNMDAS